MYKEWYLKMIKNHQKYRFSSILKLQKWSKLMIFIDFEKSKMIQKWIFLEPKMNHFRIEKEIFLDRKRIIFPIEKSFSGRKRNSKIDQFWSKFDFRSRKRNFRAGKENQKLIQKSIKIDQISSKIDDFWSKTTDFGSILIKIDQKSMIFIEIDRNRRNLPEPASLGKLDSSLPSLGGA